MFIQYIVKGNSDQTEGRGRTIDREFLVNLEDAIKIAQSGRWGVQGTVADTYVTERTWQIEDNHWVRNDVDLWGYRKDWNDSWGYGWIDHRDAPVNDPDYKEYMRLKNKFERTT